MTSVTILPIPTNEGGVRYCAVSNGKRSQGATAGEALDALTAQITKIEACTLVIVQNSQPDKYFNDEQRTRLADLMSRWRAHRDEGMAFSVREQAELDALVDSELRGATARSAALAGQFN